MYSGDMIVNLMQLPKAPMLEADIQIRRAFIGDRKRILAFIRQYFQESWYDEVEKALMLSPVKCFIAVHNEQLIGVACYDATARDFFGPVGVLDSARGKKVGAALVIRSLEAMREEGYIYAIIGWVNSAETFYRKIVNAEYIKGGEPENSVYGSRLKY